LHRTHHCSRERFYPLAREEHTPRCAERRSHTIQDFMVLGGLAAILLTIGAYLFAKIEV
jgi:hypothetical protein